MLRSMTGYGRAAANICGCDFTAEIRAVNHRYLECTVRAPRLFGYLEEKVKAQIARSMSRGKVDVFIGAELRENVAVTLNKHVARAYYNALFELRGEFALETPTLGLIARMPDVFSVKREDLDEDAVTAAVSDMVGEAVDSVNSMRLREGERLCGAIFAQIAQIGELTERIEERSALIVPEYRAKLEARLRETLENLAVDEPRIVTEAAIFADKIANNEEIVRLRSHMAELDRLLRSDTAQGRKVDFLIQELNREANTIGSKGNDAELAHLVVELKAEIEKIREQAQNLE
ncbi:hypothetical protein FACS1894202_05430 [Clostridia bacterium]|nr:hypothetical protein FACS1894202_05430 [Clostridia bacterium]